MTEKENRIGPEHITDASLGSKEQKITYGTLPPHTVLPKASDTDWAAPIGTPIHTGRYPDLPRITISKELMEKLEYMPHASDATIITFDEGSIEIIHPNEFQVESVTVTYEEDGAEKTFTTGPAKVTIKRVSE